jgi:molybdenum cofactor cytidylyltransferase
LTSPKIAAVILAAGYSRRMGKPKALLKIGSSIFHDSILEQLRTLPLDPLITVLGDAGAEIIKTSRAGPHHLFISNPQPGKGQLSSLQCALKVLPTDVRGCLLVLVDHPLVKAGTYQKIYHKAFEHPQKIIIPVYNNKGGHPVYFGRPFFTALLEAPLAKGARYVVEKNASDVIRLPVRDSAILIDIDTPEDYRTNM